MQQITVPAPGIIRLRYSPHAQFDPRPSPVLTGGFKARQGGKVTGLGALVKAETEGLVLTRDARGILLLAGPDGVPFFKSGPQGGLAALPSWVSREFSTSGGPDASAGVVTSRKKVDGVRWAFQVPAGQAWYGLGEKSGPLDRAGRSWECWNTDAFEHGPASDPLYKTIPFLIGSTPRRSPGEVGRTYWGLFLDNPSRTRFDLGRLDPRQFAYQAAFGDLDAWILAGPTPALILERYTRLTGRPFLPPLWSLGYHQSRYSYGSAREVQGIARNFARRKLPLDCIHLDIDTMDGFRVFTFDRGTFPDPAGLMRGLKRQGVHVTSIVDPGVKKEEGFALYDDGLKKGVFCRGDDGRVFSGKVWPGESVFADFFEPKARGWWGAQHAGLVKAGVEGIWNDMNEPALFEKGSMNDVIHRTPQGPKRHESLHNLFGQAMTEATAEGLGRLRPGRRNFLLTRAAYAGIQKSSAVWLGDNASAWEYLDMAVCMLQGMGLSGVPFCGADVGGFDKDCGPELLARWTQAGAVMPFFRNHSVKGSRPQEPWAFGEPVLSICRKYLELRYRLLPYIYGLFEESHRTGAPVMRPMFYEFPEEDAFVNLGHQFMLGSALLAAPVTRAGSGAREVRLPRGVWTEYWSGRRLNGGRAILAEAPLDTLPLFVREGAVLPGFEAALSSAHVDRKILRLDLFPAKGSRSTFSYYEDDGDTLAFEKGASGRREFTQDCDAEARTLKIALGRPQGHIASPVRSLHLRVHNLAGRPHRVTVDGKPWPPARHADGQVVHGLMPGHFQARLEVPAASREVLLEIPTGLVPAEGPEDSPA